VEWEIFEWFFHTKTYCSMHGRGGGTIGDVDDQFAHRARENFGAFVVGRNMFGPVRGPWSDNSWKGWWGDNPPFHAPVFILTHHEREPLVMEGGTTFYFVTGGIEEALALAKKAAGDKDVKIGGGVSTVRQFLQAGLLDSLHLASVPVLLGQGERLFDGVDLCALGFSITERKFSGYATHLTLQKVSGQEFQRSLITRKKRPMSRWRFQPQTNPKYQIPETICYSLALFETTNHALQLVDNT
jgi:dihydrofolate reductase